MFAKRTLWDLEPNALAQVVAKRKAYGLPLLDLTESNPTRCGFFYNKEAILTPLRDSRNLNYNPDPRGLLSAREAIASYYLEHGFYVHPENILLTPGTSEAYHYVFRLLCNAEDSILGPKPSYPLLEYLAGLDDIPLKHYRFQYQKRWIIDFKEVERECTSEVRLIIIVNPNNPTGTFIKDKEWERLLFIARKNNIALLSDEVFYDYKFSLGVVKQRSAVTIDEILTFTIGGISKLLGLPQMKPSWIVVTGPESQVKEAMAKLEIISDTYLALPTPVQQALPTWFKVCRSVTAQIQERVNANRALLKTMLNSVEGLNLLTSEGGWYAVIALPRNIEEEALAVRLAEDNGVVIHPGYLFDFDKEGYIVVSLLPQPSVFQAGIQYLIDHVV